MTDTCSIYAILTDWDEPFIADTHEGKFVDINTDPGIIAVAQLQSGNTESAYQEFNLKFNYRSLRQPTYILIVAAASKFGDYFTGSTSSVLYVDQFSLTY